MVVPILNVCVYHFSRNQLNASTWHQRPYFKIFGSKFVFDRSSAPDPLGQLMFNLKPPSQMESEYP